MLGPVVMCSGQYWGMVSGWGKGGGVVLVDLACCSPLCLC
jgi:hypothetical protein